MPFSGIDASLKYISDVVVNNLNGATWLVNSGIVSNVPTLGSEIITNGSFDADTTNWSAQGSSSLSSVAGGQSNNNLLVTNGGASFGYALQQKTVSVGGWYNISYYYKSGTVGGISRVGTSFGGSEYYSKTLSSVPWANENNVLRATNTNISFRLGTNSSSISATTNYDEISLKLITLASIYLTASASTATRAISTAILNVKTNTQAGVIGWLDNAATPANFIQAYHNGTQIILEKCVSGIYSPLATISNTFVAGAILELQKTFGNTFRVIYNNAAVSSEIEITDVGIISNSLFGILSTHSENTFNSIDII